MKAGKYELKVINAGFLAMDCGGIFGVIPKALWQKKVTPDEYNRLLMSTNCLLLQAKDKKILIDTGFGNGLGDKLRKIYNIDNKIDMKSSLAEINLVPEEISDVIATHLHFDHAGGLMDHKSKLPYFPNARYFTSREQFTWANHPTMIDRASFAKRNFNPLHKMSKLTLLENSEQPVDGLRFYYTKGHTPGLICIEVEDEKKPVFYCTDLFPTAYHVPLHYISSYDLYPVDLLREKRFFLKKAYEKGGILIFSHDTMIVAASVEKINNDYQIKRTFTTL